MKDINGKEIIGFWKPEEEYGYLGNWYKAEFMLDGIHFANSEQAFMYKKAMLFGDTETAEKILHNPNPRICKNLGRCVKPFDSATFEENRYSFMRDCVYAKFRGNPDLLEKLLSTGDATLAEASPKDKIWGIGISTDDPDFKNPSLWKGRNLLGKALMEVREILKKEDIR